MITQKAKTLEIAQRRAEVSKLTFKRWSTRRIAEKLGVSHMTIARDVDAILTELAEAQTKDADKIRARECETLDRVEAAALGIVIDAEVEDKELALKAADRVAKIQERRAKLLGLDAAIEVQVTQRLATELDTVLETLRGKLSGEAFEEVVAALGGGGEESEDEGEGGPAN
jgi:IS30 family transposase